MGATGTGKTELAKSIYSLMPSVIISIDAVMVYRDMDIGSAKPTAIELAEFPHELVNICSPLESYSVADCVKSVSALIKQAHAENKLPILVGGTMMYHYVLQNGMHTMPDSANDIRQQVLAEFEDNGLAFQWRKLNDLDPDYASLIATNDQQRIHRALELILQGVQPSAIQSESKPDGILAEYDLVNVVLAVERDLLYQRLMQRFDLMLEQGFVAEVANLLYKYPNVHACPAFRAIGYRQLARHVLGYDPLGYAIEQAKTATRRFAKRQCTWLKRWQNNALWLDASVAPSLADIRGQLE